MKRCKLSTLFAGLAAVGFGLRYLVYALAVDGKNLIVAGHPAVIALWLVTAAVLGLTVFISRRLPESNLFAQCFSASAPAFFGHGLLGTAMLLTVYLNPLPMPGVPGLLWKLLGLAAPAGLLAAGFSRMRGKLPFFALYIPACLFFAVHVVAHYQIWCSDPQFTGYAFALLSAMTLSLFSYQLTAFCTDLGSRRSAYLWGLSAVFLCGCELPGSLYPYLYFGGIVFCLTSLPELTAGTHRKTNG